MRLSPLPSRHALSRAGNCYAFAVTEQLESDYIRHKGGSMHYEKILSPQQLTDCAHDGTYGCGGGSSVTTMGYVEAGQELESDYPYVSGHGKSESCKSHSSKFVVYSSGYSNVKGESSMAHYVGRTGPLKLSVDADKWSSYKSGIMSNCGSGSSTNHAVQAVGVDTGNGYWKVRIFSSRKWQIHVGVRVWQQPLLGSPHGCSQNLVAHSSICRQVRNSWGESWGESGHIRFSYGHNTCNLNNKGGYHMHARTY